MSDSSYYAKVNQLGRFLSREDERGYTFACALDQRLIPGINGELTQYLSNRAGKTLRVLTLKPDGTQTLLAQLEAFLSAQPTDALVVNGLDALLSQPGFLQNFNFAREAIHDLAIPILFWATDKNLAHIGNAAADLFTQRRLTTVYFDHKPELFIEDPHLNSRFAADLRDAAEYDALQLRLNLLKQQLAEAEVKNLSRRRRAMDYALPIAQLYAELDLTEPATELLDQYAADWTEHARGQDLRDAARVARACLQYEQALNWLRQLCEMEKAKPSEQIDESLISATISDLGDILTEIGRFGEALQYYQDDLALSERLAKANPQSEQLQRDLGIAIEKLADLEKSLGLLDNARDRYALRLEISERLAKANPQSEQLQRDYAVGVYKYAQVLVREGETEQAEHYFLIDLEISSKLCEQNPKNWTLWEDLAISAESMVDRLLERKAPPNELRSIISRAIEAYQQADELTGRTEYLDKIEQYRSLMEQMTQEEGS